MNTVEVFKTNVPEQPQADLIVSMLSEKFPLSRINFDLDDGDKILRIEGSTIESKKLFSWWQLMDIYVKCLIETIKCNPK